MKKEEHDLIKPIFELLEKRGNEVGDTLIIKTAKLGIATLKVLLEEE